MDGCEANLTMNEEGIVSEMTKGGILSVSS